MVGGVLDHVHVRRDPLQDRRGFLVPSQSAQRHVPPVGDRDELVGIGRHGEVVLVRRHGGFEIALQVVGEREVVVDVRLQGARRDAALVGLAVRFHLVGLPRHQRGGVRQVRDRPVELAHADPAVPAVAVHARVLGVLGRALREDLDRLPVPPRVADPAAQPDDRVRIVGVGLVVGAGGGLVLGLSGGHIGRGLRGGWSGSPSRDMASAPSGSGASAASEASAGGGSSEPLSAGPQAVRNGARIAAMTKRVWCILPWGGWGKVRACARQGWRADRAGQHGFAQSGRAG